MNIEEIKNALDVMERTLHPDDYKILVDGVSQAVRNHRQNQKDEQVSDDLVELGIALAILTLSFRISDIK